MLTTSDWGFVLLVFIICNGFTWLLGFDLNWKEKILMPNIIVLACIGLVIAFKLMGVGK